MSVEKQLDTLIAGVARVDGRVIALDERLTDHTAQDDRNFGDLRMVAAETSIAVARLETAAGIQERFATVASRRANRRWTVAAALAAIVSAGAALASFTR